MSNNATKYPFSPEFQVEVLALLLKDIPFLRNNKNVIKPSYFDNPLFAKFCKVVLEYYHKYAVSPSKAVLGELLELKPDTPEQFLYDRIYETTVSDAEYVTESVRRFAKFQAVKRQLSLADKLLANENYDLIEKGLYEALHTGEESYEGPRSYFDNIDNLVERIKTESRDRRFVESLIPEVDNALNGGIRPAELNIIMGTPGSGKSVWLINMAYGALFTGKNVLYISMEMSADWVERRLSTRITGIPTERQAYESEELLRRVREVGVVMGEMRTQFWPSSTASVADVRALLDKLAHVDDFRPDLVLVDYLELFDVLDENEYVSQGRTAKVLRGLSAEYNFGLWVATQARRSAMDKTHLKMDDKADSFRVMQDADVVIGLQRTEDNVNNNTVNVSFAKLRNSGATSFVKPLKGNYEKMFIGSLN